MNITSKYNHLLYKRGYVISDNKIKPPIKSWKQKRIGKYYIYFDRLNNVSYKKRAGKWVFVLGDIIDTVSLTDKLDIISQKLLTKLFISEEHFYNYIDNLSGRYFILYFDSEITRILSDATGMRSIVYSTDRTLLASHTTLLQRLTNSENNRRINTAWKKQYKGYYIPGHFTIYKNIYYLTPNTLLELETKKVERFFPRENLELHNIDDVATKIGKSVKDQIALLSKRKNKLIFSLTAGNDSRTTLSLVKDYVDKIEFFTYYKVPSVKSLDIDRVVVDSIAKNLRLNHQFIQLNQSESDNDYHEFIEVMKQNTLTPHGFKLAKFYYENLPNNSIHIRSNILEIGRYFYRERHRLPEKADGKSMAQCYSKLAVNDNDIIELFEEYYDHTKMDRIYNYDPFDILYWEYRMGIWHSQLILESDIAHDTFIPFNSRSILKSMLSVSQEDKANYSVFKKIIEQNWPILNYWGINTIENKYTNNLDKVDRPIAEHGLSLSKATFTTSSDAVKVKSIIRNKTANFYMDKTNPSLNDFAQINIPLSTHVNIINHIILHVRSPYESTKHFGRLKYQIIVNDVLILEEDISHWKETNQVNIHFKASEPKTRVSIRVVSTMDCEAWNWGKAGTIVVERITLRKSHLKTNAITCTSPYSKVYNI